MRVVVVGAGGRLGAALVRDYRRHYHVTGFNHAQLDLGLAGQMHAKLDPLEFDVLINCAALTNVDQCEREPETAFLLNAEAPRVLAEICTAKNARLIHVSTDYVFDGEKSEPYTEEDEANPISVYGESKREGEGRVLAVDQRHLVARVSWVFGPDRPSFVDWLIGRAREHERLEAIADKFSTPTYTQDLAEMLRRILDRQDWAGLLHLANTGECSWCEFGQWALDCCHAEGVPLRSREVHPISLKEMKQFIARRPIYTVLDTARYEGLTHATPRDWHDAVADYVREYLCSEKA